jgi:hypothetical protein
MGLDYPAARRQTMTFTFYTLGETIPCFTFTASGVGLWDDFCEAIADHVLDEEEYVEAIYVQGKLVGSVGGPFWLDPSEYVKI